MYYLDDEEIEDENEERELTDNQDSNSNGLAEKVDNAQNKMQDIKNKVNLGKDIAKMFGGNYSGLLKKENWKTFFKEVKKALKISCIGFIVGIMLACFLLIVLDAALQKIKQKFVELSDSVELGMNIFIHGTDAFITDDYIEKITNDLLESAIEFDEIAYAGEKIFSTVGLSLGQNGKYTVSNPEYRLNNDNTKLDEKKCMKLYIERYLQAQAYTINKHKITFSSNKGAITVDNLNYLVDIREDENGRIYVLINNKYIKYIDDIVDGFTMPWFFPYAFHSGTLCPDLGWEIAELSKKYHSLKLTIKEIEYSGKRLQVQEDPNNPGNLINVWVDFASSDYVVLVKEKSTWFSKEIYEYKKVVDNINNETEVSTQTRWVMEENPIIDESNREEIKALINSNAKYYRANELSAKTPLQFETSAQIVIELLKGGYFKNANTSVIQTNETIRNVMRTFYELGYLSDTALNENITMNFEDYIVYGAPLKSGLPENWPKLEEAYSDGYVKFIGSYGEDVVSVVNGEIVDINFEGNYMLILDEDTKFVVKYENFGMDSNISIGQKVIKGQVLGKLGNDTLKLQVINDIQQIIDPTTMFTFDGEGVEMVEGFIYYNQGADPWGKMMYSSVGNTSQTYKSSACGPTTLAIVAANVNRNPNITPLVVGSTILNNAQYRKYRSVDNGTSAAIFTDAEFLSNFNLTPGKELGGNPQLAVQMTENGYIVAIIQTHMSSNGGTSGHYLVFAPSPNGENGLMTVLDPASRNVTGIRTYSQFASIRRTVNFRNAWAFEL